MPWRRKTTEQKSTPRTLSKPLPRTPYHPKHSVTPRKPPFFNAYPVVVKGSPSMSTLKKNMHLYHLDNLYQIAQRDARTPNHKDEHFATAIHTTGQPEIMRSNLTVSEHLTSCDLMNAHHEKSFIERQNAPRVYGASPQPPAPKDINTIYIISSDISEDGIKPTPCSECLDLMVKADDISLDTDVITLIREPNTSVPKNENPNNLKPLTLHVRQVRDLLPLHMRSDISFVPTIPVKKLALSKATQAFLAQTNASFNEKDLRSLVKEALTAYNKNTFAERSQQPVGASILAEPGHQVMAMGRFDWAGRLFEMPDLMLVANVLSQSKNRLGKLYESAYNGLNKFETTQRISNKLPDRSTRVTAIAYISNDEHNTPPIKSLGRMVKRRLAPETSIITVENDVIEIRSIVDYMPEIYETP